MPECTKKKKNKSSIISKHDAVAIGPRHHILYLLSVLIIWFTLFEMKVQQAYIIKIVKISFFPLKLFKIMFKYKTVMYNI